MLPEQAGKAAGGTLGSVGGTGGHCRGTGTAGRFLEEGVGGNTAVWGGGTGKPWKGGERQVEVSEDGSQQMAEWRAGPHWAQQLRSPGHRRAQPQLTGFPSQRERFFRRRQPSQEGDGSRTIRKAGELQEPLEIHPSRLQKSVPTRLPGQ